MLQLPLKAFGYFSVATVLAEAAVLLVLLQKGNLNQETLVRVLAIANDVDLQAMWREAEVATRNAEVEELSFDDMRRARLVANLDLDLREIAGEKGLLDIQQVNDDLTDDWARYNALWQRFDERRTKLEEGSVDLSRQDLQKQLETIDPKLAKDQIIRMLNATTTDPETALQLVVAVVKNMEFERRKKILAGFREDDEKEQLHQILKRIRLGLPDVELIRDTREQLRDLDSHKQGGTFDDTNSA